MANTNLSRLDQVFTLLENGASAIARKAAAKQLGDVQKKHPTELNILLSKLLPYIRHTEWETRVAGIEAIEALVEQVPIWTIDDNSGEKETDSTDVVDDTLLQFDKFDVDRLLSCSETLLSSSGEEMNISLDPKDRAQQVKYQRKYLEKSLGLHSDSALNIGFSSTCLFKDEDLIVKEEQADTKSKVITKETCEVVMGKMFENMSSREKNFAKRKAKMMLKQKSRENRKIDDKDQPARKQRKTDTAVTTTAENAVSSCSEGEVPKHLPEPEEWTEWPFKWFYENLLDLLFNSAWESRHGACMAIRILLKRHGGTLGKVAKSPQNKLRHQHSLDDLAVRLLSVIALDRFADYVSDQVVAPVRESCAQALSVVTTFMEPEHVFKVVRVLLHLRTKEEWQLRQSAIVTLQYIIAMRKEILPELLPMCLNDIMKGLYDRDGDVRSVAAKALMPTTHILLSDSKYDDFVNKLLIVLWDSLLDYDELTASTHSVMLLLSNIISQLPKEKVVCKDEEKTEMLTTRLWPFFLHVDEAVRKAAISTFHTVLTAVTDENDRISWKDATCSGALVNLFCSCLFEKCEQIQQQTVSAFLSCLRSAGKSSMLATVDHFSYWILMACQPVNLAYETNVLELFPVLRANGRNIDDQKFIGGVYPNTTNQHDAIVHVMRTRCNLTKMIGTLCWHAFPRQGGNNNGNRTFSCEIFEQVLSPYLSSQTSLHQTVASNTIKAVWEEALYLKQIPVWLSVNLRNSIDSVLNQNLYYAEIAPHILEMQADTQAFVQTLNDTGASEKLFPQCGFSLDEVISFCSELDSTLHTSKAITGKAKEELIEQRDFIVSCAEKANIWYTSLDNQCKSSGSGIVVQSALCIKSLKIEATDTSAMWNLPPKLNSIIRPLMDTLKREENVAIVERAADSLAQLFGLCANRVPSPNGKLIKNMTLSLTSLLSLCPTCDHIKSEFSDNVLHSFGLTSDSVIDDGVITMLRQRSVHDSNGSKRTKYKSPTDEKHLKSLNGDTASRNAALCLRRICKMYQKDVFTVAPMVLDILQNLKKEEYASKVDDNELKPVIQGLTLLKVVFSAISDEKLTKDVLSYLPQVINLLYHKRANVRFIASNCLAALAAHRPDGVLPDVIEKVLPEFESDDFVRRKGAIEAVTSIVKGMGAVVVNYAVLLVVPLLGKMGDFESQVRLLATSCFARLMQYIPVESSIPDPVNMPASLIEKKLHERKFLDQLFDSSALEEYPVPIPIKAKLRSYQQDGVKWLAFLNRYKLHGILCDDMGLGKTLQTICIMASDHFYKTKQDSSSASKKKKKVLSNRLISLVVCPPTLTGHWIEETKRFCDHLDPLHYTGIPVERIKLQDEVYKHNMVVASYEVVRNDINFFSRIRWNYCVLDEGHVIRNGKSKTSQCVKTLIANHRLILTGTPIQNNVLELWSLFDFLIPGFLGTEYEFTVRYTKPILASRDAKSSSKEQEMGLLAMNALHRQVLPFMLRRMKEDVLKDLPPKIIQDYYCDLSPLQMELYEDFAKSRAKKVAESSIKEFDEDEMEKCGTSNKTSHVFQALQYLQKVCNHPAFVLTPNHPQYARFSEKLKTSNNSLKDIKNSCKLTALKQLLLDCGIGETSSSSETTIVSQHRALIFCLHKNMLDVIERDLFRPLMPTVTFLRLDGSVPASQRFSTVSKFNNDPSIDVLLLSTKVGGLGLNLTGADTVIFVEHDWNPTTDLQAMDRAHRIGQKKVVNVYRIITRGTLEEKILGLQKFKLNLANTIVSQDNRALSSMGTNQVLDLFKVGENDNEAKKKKRQDSSSRGFKAMIDGLSELWDQSQYDEQYNLDNFIRSMQ